GCTLDAMRGWWLKTPDLLPVQLEAVTRDYDDTMRTIFRHFGFNEAECDIAVELAAPFDIARMSDAAIAQDPHIHSRTLSKWRDFLPPDQLHEFERRYADLIVGLGYRLSQQGEPDATAE